MKLENQVVPIEQAKRLKELGVIQKSFLCWTNRNGLIATIYEKDEFYEDGDVYIMDKNTPIWADDDKWSAYGVAELGVMLPQQYIIRKSGNGWEYKIPNTDSDWSNWRHHSTEAQARAAMLIYLLTHNLTTAAEVNERLKNA